MHGNHLNRASLLVIRNTNKIKLKKIYWQIYKSMFMYTIVDLL